MIETAEFEIKKIEQSRISQVDFNNIPFGKVYADHMFVAEFTEVVVSVGMWCDSWNSFQRTTSISTTAPMAINKPVRSRLEI